MNLENFIEETKSLVCCDEHTSTSDLNANLETSNEKLGTYESMILSKELAWLVEIQVSWRQV